MARAARLPQVVFRFAHGAAAAFSSDSMPPMPWSLRRPLRVLAGTMLLLLVPALAPAVGTGGITDPGQESTPSPSALEVAGMGSERRVDPGLRHATADASILAFQQELMALARTGSRTERWGIQVVSLDRGDTLFEMNADEAMAPASNMKLFTSAAALHLLGPDFRFTTWLLAAGPIEEGVLHGDLLLYGTGDPTLGSRSPQRPTEALAHFVEAVSAAGIREIRGQVIGDATHFSGNPRRPSWNPNDLDNWFAAPVSSLIFNENMVTLRVDPSRGEGLPPRIHTIPEGAGVPVRNEARVQASSGNVAIFRDDPDGPIRVTGAMGRRQVEAWRSITVSDPAHYAASVLRATLETHGIQVSGGVGSVDLREGTDPATGASMITGRALVAPAFGAGEALRTLAVHHSPPVSELIHPVNRRSHNLYADALLLAMARAAGEPGSFEGGSEVLSRFLVEVVGADPSALHVEDGSGLSRLNRTTARDLVRLLAWVDRSTHAETFHASLPEAGNRRELGRMERTAAAGNLRAKTGTIHRVSALSGVVRSADGERLLFSLLVNDVPSTWAAKRAEDRLGVQLAEFRRGPRAGLPPFLPAQ